MSIPYDDKNELLIALTEYFLVNDTMDQEIYDNLLQRYKPFGEDKEAYELYIKIIDDKSLCTRDNMAYITIEELLLLINKDSSDLILETLYEYHFTFNREYLLSLYNRLLNNNIGKKVNVITFLPNKEKKYVNGELKAYNEKESITVDDEVIPFVGFKSFIKDIKNEKLELLYTNFLNTEPNDLSDDIKVQTEKDKIFGDKKIEGPIR